MIWLVFVNLTIVALLLLLVGGKRKQNTIDPIDHFRAQLAEIDADVATGVIEGAAADAARIEIQRRMLRAGQSKTASVVLSGDYLSKGALAGLAAFMVVSVFGVYTVLGSPDTPSAAKSEREQSEERSIEEGGPTFGEAIAQVQAHLVLNPRDMRGWEVLGKSAGAVGDYALAAEAFGELARMNPQNPDWRLEEFEAFVAHANGQITPAARLVLAALMDIEPNHPAGQFYVGLTQLQAGNEAGAKSTWLALADRSSPDAPWLPLINRQLAALGVAPPQLSSADIDAVNAMSTEEREVFIQSMMGRLQERLESSPDDPNGWAMLARSQLAMGDREGAISTLKSGILAVSDQNAAELQAFLDNLLVNIDP
ncbi:c-type cytochrome biogenesis protein CcmI [Kordiimonas aquimaris]|uniref:c-type cytochrome biogenesis protein CcmI n=1 Tax=Kordiimonas aquimaris TaxID=707591 RepID=UPI0021D1F01D|nr:c-type cytochrome biogenesis protein CcmI [Kordiimonas aquimaris]